MIRFLPPLKLNLEYSTEVQHEKLFCQITSTFQKKSIMDCSGVCWLSCPGLCLIRLTKMWPGQRVREKMLLASPGLSAFCPDVPKLAVFLPVKSAGFLPVYHLYFFQIINNICFAFFNTKYAGYIWCKHLDSGLKRKPWGEASRKKTPSLPSQHVWQNLTN